MVISQSDIDELLNSALEDPGEDEESGDSRRVSDDKVYRSPKIEAKRILFPYQSPIVKSSNIVYNPRGEKYSVEDKIVVRSLENYVEYRKNNAV